MFGLPAFLVARHFVEGDTGASLVVALLLLLSFRRTPPVFLLTGNPEAIASASQSVLDFDTRPNTPPPELTRGVVSLESSFIDGGAFVACDSRRLDVNERGPSSCHGSSKGPRSSDSPGCCCGVAMCVLCVRLCDCLKMLTNFLLTGCLLLGVLPNETCT